MEILQRLIHPCCLLLFAQPLFFPCPVASERIVIFHGVSSYSHRVQTWPVAVALSERGDRVSYISPYYAKDPHPNISELVPKKMEDFSFEFQDQEYDINLRVRNELLPLYQTEFDMAYGICEALLSSPELADWLSKEENQKVDLFIVDQLYPECGLALARHVGAKKAILFNTVAVAAYEYDAIGFLPQSSAIPEIEHNPHTVPMGFFDRISNTMTSIRWRYEHYRYSLRVDTLLRDSFKSPQMPFVGDLLSNVSLIFSTGDVVSDYPRALPPLFVNVGGTHCRESKKPLPEEMEAFINKSIKPGEKNDGFIYISLGSLAISSNLPDRIKQVFFDVVRSFPNIKFLWKWNGEFPANIPENLFLSKWFPQIEVLSHSKIRAFITQNGRPSTLEALNLGVPMISFPIAGDQDLNANRLHEMDATVKLEIGTVTFKELREAVEKVVYDPRVKERMTRLQTIFRDRPMPPVETAVWWVDYVLRHEDTSHLRPTGNDQYWFVRRQIDVWAFLSIITFSTIVGVLVVICKVFSIFIPKKGASKKLKKS